MTRYEQFDCRIDRDDDGQIVRLQVTVNSSDPQRTVMLNGDRAARIAGPLHDILRSGGVTGRQWSTGRPIALDQTTGAHAWLLLDATRALRRADRLDEVGEGIARMSREEASYWYAKSRQPRGLRAARLLLSDDARRR